VAAWIEKTYVRFNFNGFTGDRKFVHDMDAQKAFSKLRSSIGGIYAWRLYQGPPEYRPKNEQQKARLYREADFALKQAFLFCPYSPEAVFRYAQLLMNTQRIDDALIVAETCLKLDPYNGQVIGLTNNLQTFKKQMGQQTGLQQLEAEVRTHPTNYQAAFDLASAYMQMQNTERADQVLDGVLNAPNVDSKAVVAVAQAYVQMKNWPRLEAVLEKLVKIMPGNPEAWYDLAAFKSNLGKPTEAIAALTQAVELSRKRLLSEPKAHDLLTQARTDERFNPLHQLPEFQKLVAAQQAEAPAPK